MLDWILSCFYCNSHDLVFFLSYSALFDTPTIATQMEDSLSLSSDDTESESGARSPCSPDAGITFPLLGSCYAVSPCSSLLGKQESYIFGSMLFIYPCKISEIVMKVFWLSSHVGSFEESVLNGRLEPVSTVQGFSAEIGASGSFCPRHLKLPVTVFFYTLGDYDKVSTPYLVCLLSFLVSTLSLKLSLACWQSV